MNREILFRGKRIDNGEWVEGYVVRPHHIGDKGIKSYYFNALDENGWVSECIVSAETVCQYTGLTDKNKMKIFEGDICDRKEQFPEIVTYHDGDWTLDYSYASGKESGCNYCNLGFYAKERRGGVEVIGNIFDNPELVEKQKCSTCKCRSCFYKSECCPECEGAILGCEEYSETDIYKPDLLEGGTE